jgi:hypothetical protein
MRIITTISGKPATIVEIEGPGNGALRPRHEQFPHYYPWTTTDEADQWLMANVSHDVHVIDISFSAIEQGGAVVSGFTGLKFVFADPKEAMLFKLRWV